MSVLPSQIRETLGLDFTPTDEQAAIVGYPLRRNGIPQPLLVVAGAGSGKTATMAVRAAFAVAQKEVRPAQILGLTFTRKAAAELQERLSGQIPGDEESGLDFGLLPVSTTYNAFALKVVEEFGPLIGLPPHTVHMDSAAAWQLMNDVVRSRRSPLPERSATAIVDAALSLREDIANQGMTVDQAEASLQDLQGRFVELASERKKLPQFWASALTVNQERLQLMDVIREFDDRRRESGRTDFADQVLLATRIVSEVPYAVEVLRDRHQAVFLDEFQDTSVSQMDFLAKLFHDHPVTAVGDPNQAIYGWRGASAAALDDFHSRFNRNESVPDTALTLSTSWRNYQRILDVANTISAPLRQAASDAGSIQSPVLEASPKAGEGTVHLSYQLSQEDQIDHVIEFVGRAREELEGPQGQGAEVAVLCRRRSMIAPLLRAFREAQIPAETVGADGLLYHPAVADLRAFLSVAHDVGDSTSLLRLLLRLQLGTDDLWRLGRAAAKAARQSDGRAGMALLSEAVADVDNAGLSDRGTRRVKILSDQIESLRATISWDLNDQIARARIVSRIEEEALVMGEYESVAEVLDTFVDAAATYQDASDNAGMEGFLTWLEAAESRERGLRLPQVQPNPGAVQVMTVHAAKGLQWDAVAVVDLELSAFPSYRGSPARFDSESGEWVSPLQGPPGQSAWWKSVSTLPYPVRHDAKHLPEPDVWRSDITATAANEILREDFGRYLLEEERRLAYVAVTRPRLRLGLFGSWLGSGSRPRFPSMFFTEAESLDGVISNTVPSPTDDQIADHVNQQAEAVFPQPPDSLHKDLHASAQLVEEEIVSPRATEEAALAELPLPLRAELTALLEELRRNEEARGKTLAESASEEVVASISQGGHSFNATNLGTMASSDSMWIDLRRPIPPEPSDNALLGTAFHRLAEERLRRAAAIDLDTEERITGKLTAKQRADLRTLHDRFESLPWLDSSTPVGLEVPFAIDVEGILIRGRIDAVVSPAGANEDWVIDWKTGRAPRGDALSERLTDYLAQLDIYHYAWSQRTDRTVTSFMVFLGGKETEILTLEDLKKMYFSLHHEEWTLHGRAAQLSGKIAPH